MCIAIALKGVTCNPLFTTNVPCFCRYVCWLLHFNSFLGNKGSIWGPSVVRWGGQSGTLLAICGGPREPQEIPQHAHLIPQQGVDLRPQKRTQGGPLWYAFADLGEPKEIPQHDQLIHQQGVDLRAPRCTLGAGGWYAFGNLGEPHGIPQHAHLIPHKGSI